MSLPVDKTLREARNLMKAGELAQAEELYKQILSKFPKNKKGIDGYQKLKAGITSKGSENSEPPQEKVQELINLYNQGQFEDALVSVRRLISLFPKAIILHNIHGASNTALQRHDAAIDSYKQAIKINPNYADSYNNMGAALHDKGDSDAAIDSYKQAIKINPNYADAYYNMGNAFKKKGDLNAVMGAYTQAIKFKPEHAGAYYNIGLVLSDLKFSKPNSDLSQIIVKIIDKKNYVRPSDIAPAAVSLIKLDKVFQSVLSRFFSGELEHTLEQTVSELSRIPLLLKIMEVCPIPDLEVERLLTSLRSAILKNVSQLSASKESLIFQTALALQCFTNEYIYSLASEDTKFLNELENNVQKNLADGKQPAPIALACIASFKILHDYSWCHLLIIPDELKQLAKRQIFNFETERAIRVELTNLFEITEGTSLKVRQQYEESPYPRWVNLGLPQEACTIYDAAKNINLRVHNEEIYDCDAPQILVAGCGTGQHSITAAAKFRNCNVLAVDLSVSSLAYAKRKTEEQGFKNINYMQADILDLRKLDRQFDIIESSGVLHHMTDPMAGWKILTDCLKPGGLMKIGLYSELARQDINKMRKEIQRGNFSSDNFSMKSFRTDVIHSDQKHHKKILSSHDFYSLSMLRDLLFHVQEYQFTIPQIKYSLNELRMEFCGFENDRLINSFKCSYANPNDIYDLEKWNSFEHDNPRAFAGMYQFWCQKMS